MEGRNRILFISSWYPNRNNPSHGIFNRAFAEAAAIYNQVSVLHVSSDPHQKEYFEIVENEEAQIHTVLVYYKKLKATDPLTQLRKRNMLLKAFDLGYERLLQKGGIPQIIQLNVVLPAGLAVLHLSKKHRLPYVINEGWTGYCPEDGRYKGFFTKYFTKKIVAGAAKIMPVSQQLMQCMQAHGLSGSYEVVPNVVNTGLFVPVPAAQKPGTRFIHISALDDRQKNVSGIIRAFSMALKKNEQLELYIVGDGADMPRTPGAEPPT